MPGSCPGPPTPKGDGAFEAFFYGLHMYNYQKYESLKAEWIKSNPGAMPAEYEAAMKVIAAKCGV